MEYKRLTVAEEKIVLNEIMGGHSVDYFGRGSSRVVYEIGDELAEALMLEPGRYIVKIALGIGGINQNNREVQAYLTYGKNYPLARIARSGKFVVIMEQLDLLDDIYRDCEVYDFGCWEDLYDYVNDVEGAYREFINDLDPTVEDKDDFEFNDLSATYPKREVLAVWDAICELSDLFGDTSDNAQLGYNSDGDIVCYDYGFCCGSSDWHSAAGRLYGEHYMQYLALCIENLEFDENFAELEKEFVKTLS